MKYALQLYSIKGVSEGKGLKETLRLTAEYGYDSVEFAGFFGLTTEQVLEELKKNNLEVMGLHHGYGELKKDAASCVKLAKDLGAYSLCVPHFDANTVEAWVDFAKEMNEYGKMFREAGILFGYHNHIHEHLEFFGTSKIDILLENTDKENVFFEMDTRHTQLSGANPVEYAKKYSDRIKVLHARDTDGTEDCGVGAGIVDFKNVIDACKVNMFVVENENFGKNEQQLIDSASYLRKNF